MNRIKCIDGLDYHKVIFRKELADLIRHAVKGKVDYIHSIELSVNGGFIVNYMSNDNMISYYDRYNLVAKRIDEFYKVEQRVDKLKELGI